MRPNLANSITFFRILLIPLFMAFLLGAVPFGGDAAQAMRTGGQWAAAVFALAAATDMLDGYTARRRREVTMLGAFLDPLADKLLVSGALVALVQLQKLSAWVAMVIIAREFAVSGLRMVAAAEGVIIPASLWGKVKTACQLLAVMAVILDPSWVLAGHRIDRWLVGLAVVLTVTSGVDYFVRARGRLHGPRVRSGKISAAAVERDAGETRAP